MLDARLQNYNEIWREIISPGTKEIWQEGKISDCSLLHISIGDNFSSAFCPIRALDVEVNLIHLQFENLLLTLKCVAPDEAARVLGMQTCTKTTCSLSPVAPNGNSVPSSFDCIFLSCAAVLDWAHVWRSTKKTRNFCVGPKEKPKSECSTKTMHHQGQTTPRNTFLRLSQRNNSWWRR